MGNDIGFIVEKVNELVNQCASFADPSVRYVYLVNEINKISDLRTLRLMSALLINALSASIEIGENRRETILEIIRKAKGGL